MQQLTIRCGILYPLFAVLALVSATAYAATLNVTVTDAQSGEKLDSYLNHRHPSNRRLKRGDKRCNGGVSIRGVARWHLRD